MLRFVSLKNLPAVELSAEKKYKDQQEILKDNIVCKKREIS